MSSALDHTFMAQTSGVPRHHLVWLSDDGWRQAHAGLGPEHQTVCQRWRRADWPLVVRRNDCDAGQAELCLGLAAPPDATDGKKLRLGFRVAAAAVRTQRAPLAIAEVLAQPQVPAAWRTRLQIFDAERLQRDLGAIRVYGSLALQTLTGQTYLTASSDIDLLFEPNSQAQLERGMALLCDHAAHLPLDGEIIFPGGQAVAWKEWRQAQQSEQSQQSQQSQPAGFPAQVMVKQINRVFLSPMASLLASLTSLEQRACPS